jgi:hypothetical protein
MTTKNCEAAMNKPIKIVDTVKAFHSNEDGTTCEKDVDVEYINRRFFITLPAWVSAFADNNDAVIGDGVNSVVTAYEAASEEYSRWKLAFNAEPKIALKIIGAAAEVGDGTVVIGPMVGFRMRPVAVTPAGEVYERKEDGALGRKYDSLDYTYLLDDAPEVRAKAQRLMDSIANAWSVLNEMSNWSDPQAYFLSIPEHTASAPTPAPAPAQAALPLEEPAATAAAPAAPAADDDEEL